MKGSELVRTSALATKVEHCTFVCPCPCISTRGWLESDVVGVEPNSEQEQTKVNEERSDCS